MGTAAGNKNCVLLWGWQWRSNKLCVRGTVHSVPPPHLNLQAVWAGFPACARIQPLLRSHLFHNEGNVPEDDNSLFAYSCKVTWIDFVHTLSWESPIKINL